MMPQTAPQPVEGEDPVYTYAHAPAAFENLLMTEAAKHEKDLSNA